MSDALSTLKPAQGSAKRRKRIGRGRGSGHGKTSCRGQKGYGARSGVSARPGFEGGQMPLYRRLPKRGFRNRSRQEYTVINIRDLERWGEAVVSLELLGAKGLLGDARARGVKLLGEGDPTRAYKVTVHCASGGAKTKIEKAGGEVTLVAR